MVRMCQTGFSDEEWIKVSNWLSKSPLTLYELLKRGALEYVDRYASKDSVDVPDQIRILVGDLKRYNRKAFDHAANIRWLKGRHGVTESTANEALRIYEVEVLSVL